MAFIFARHTIYLSDMFRNLALLKQLNVILFIIKLFIVTDISIIFILLRIISIQKYKALESSRRCKQCNENYLPIGSSHKYRFEVLSNDYTSPEHL